MLSGVANAQRTITVANGTATSSYVPIYGTWTDSYLRCQTIYPEELISEMTGGTIMGLSYFLSSPASEATSATFEIKIGSAPQSSFTSSTFLSNTNFATVYTGSINLTTQTCNITFSTPYLYEGGDLVIEVNCINRGNYSSTDFYGIDQTGGSTQGYSSSSWSSVSGTIRNFIPKTEFSFQEGDVSCPTPTMNPPAVDGTDVTISWTENGTATSYAVYLNNVQVEIVNNTTTYTFHNLNYITTYSAKVRAICAPDDTSYGSSRSFTTPCGTEALPYNEGFENFATGSSNFPACWTNMSGSNYVQANYASTGSNSMHVSGPGTVLTPPLATNGRAIEVSFSARSYDRDDAGTIQVGFTTDAIAMTDVQWTAAIQPSDEEHHIYEVSFEHTGSTATGYVVFRQNASYSYDYYNIDDIYVGVMSNCRRPEDITVQTIARTGVGITWTPPASGAPEAYIFEYKQVASSNWISQTVHEPYVLLTGLTLGTLYDARVRSVCGSEYSRDRSTTFRTPACGIEVGGGATTNSTVPFQGYYGYGYSQAIYPASALNNLDTIYGIAYNCSGTNSHTYVLDVYMANTTTQSVSTSNYIAATNLTRVASNRSLNFTSGWNEISFDTPFIYDGSSNLAVVVDNNTGSYESGLSFVHHAATSGSSCYWYGDGTNINPSSPSASSSSTISTLPDIRFLVSCEEADCQAPLLVPEVLSSHEVALHWQPMTSESSWTVEYKLLNESNWTIATTNATTTDYTINDLNAGRDYQFRVTANCGGDNCSSVVNAFTKCDLFDVTYREDFSSGAINPCWAVSQTSYLYPTVVGGVLYTGTDNSTWVILPEFVEPLSLLMIKLTAQHSADNGTLSVGVTTGQDIASFEELNTFDYTTDITEIEDFFDVYSGNGTNIALKFNTGYTNIDNIVVSIAPSCRKPTNIRVVEVEATTATLEWDAGDNATGATVRYRRNGGNWNTVTVEGNTVTLENLVANAKYEVIVRAICSGDESSDNSKTFTFRTSCANGSLNVTESYPFIEDFENGVYCWQQEFVSGELEWVTQRGDGESNAGAHGIDTAYQGKYNAVLYNLLVYTSGPKTRIISPLLNTESLVQPYLKYSYGLTSYHDYGTNSNYSDEMSVYYRTNANSPWVPLKSYNTATTGWVRDSVALETTSTTFQISFLGYFKGGNGVAIDDVRVYTLGHDTRIDDGPTYTGIDDIDQDSERFNVAIYPNPASGSTTVQIDGANGSLTVAVMDMSGRTIKTEQVYCNSGCTHQVNLSGLAQGAYFVRVTGDQVNTVRKLIVK